MNVEIEYRFLITKEKFKEVQSTLLPKVIQQGYLLNEKAFHTRVRIESFNGESKSSLTTKIGKKPAREEYEEEIKLDHAQILFNKSKKKLIKWRYEVMDEFNQKWEIDFYPDHNLVVAEIEVSSLDYVIQKPSWVGMEVTHNNKFSNTSLAR